MPMTNARVLALLIGLTLGGLLLVAPWVPGGSQPSQPEVNPQALLEARLDNFTALLREELPEAADNLLPFLEPLRSGAADVGVEALVQAFTATAVFLATLRYTGKLDGLGYLRLQQAAALLADGLIIARPDLGLALYAGLYRGPQGDERVVSPFLANCAQTWRIQGVGDFELQECVPFWSPTTGPAD